MSNASHKLCEDIKRELLSLSSQEREEKNISFFKMGKGQYSESDEFIGVSMPDIRKVAKQCSMAPFPVLKELLQSQIHEERMCALVILVNQMKIAVKNKDEKTQEEITKFYLAHKKHVNNWDLVDVSAHYILGEWIITRPSASEMLYTLVDSPVLWDRRIAMVSQWLMIRKGRYEHVLPLAKELLADEEDLMHKAVGWMLREYWKKEPEIVEEFLQKNYKNIPRTTLRYAIERMQTQKRKEYLTGTYT